MSTRQLNRRGFLKLSGLTIVGAFGVLSIGCSMFGKSPRLLRSEMDIDKDFLWVSIDESNQARLIVTQSEMGQGIHTGLAQIVAEEMNLDLSTISVVTGSGKNEYENMPIVGQMTGGSTSIQQLWEPMRQIGASCADLILRAGAQYFDVKPQDCYLENNFIMCGDKKTSFASVAKIASSLEVNDKAKAKAKKDYKLVGKKVKRLESLAKITGKADFGIDAHFPNMLYASIFLAPVRGAVIKSIDKKATVALDGVVEVIDLQDSVAVVAKDYYTAQMGIDLLQVDFTNPETMPIKDMASLDKRLSEYLDELDDVKHEMQEEAKEYNGKVIDMTYEVPYLSHATLEPMNATVFAGHDFCEAFVPTQAQTMVIDAIKEITGLDNEQIKLHTTFLGGGFGRRAEVDFVKQAVSISYKLKKPIKLIYSRSEDLKSDAYRPSAKSRFLVTLVGDRARSWVNYGSSEGILKKFIPPLKWLGIAPMGGEGASEIPYEIEDFDYSHKDVNLGVNVGFWRSVGHSHNAFFVESAIDEVANELEADPLLFRLKQLGKEEVRYKIILEEIKKFASWGTPQEGYAQGIAVHASFNSLVAMVIEVKKDTPKLELGNCYIVADAGDYVNPHLVRQQLIGAAVLGLSAAIYEEITFSDHKINQTNFPDYNILPMSMTPAFHAKLLYTSYEVGGVGEIATPPAAPALANAIYQAKQMRIRKLPIKNSIDV